MRAIIAIVLIFVILDVQPVLAGRHSPIVVREFPFDQFRIEVYRNGRATTLANYQANRKEARFATTTGFSNRRGAAAGLLMLKGVVHQGNYRKRGFLQVDKTGRGSWIDYRLHPKAANAFAAGPVIRFWEDGRRSGTYIAEREERFSHAFVTANTERSVFCIDQTKAMWVIMRFRGSLWRIADIVRDRKLRCINTDGGSQLAQGALNPAILGIIYDPLLTGAGEY